MIRRKFLSTFLAVIGAPKLAGLAPKENDKFFGLTSIGESRIRARFNGWVVELRLVPGQVLYGEIESVKVLSGGVMAHHREGGGKLLATDGGTLSGNSH